MGAKIAHLDGIILKELNRILLSDTKNPKLRFVSITEVKVTRDLSYATIYVTFYDGHKRLKELNEAKGYLRSKLAKSLNIRKIPELNFVLDDSFDKAKRIEDILEGLNK